MKKAFTIAEVLIALTIIGVIAAITLPVLSNSYNDRMYDAALKKNFSVLSNAFNLSKKYDYIEYEDWDHRDSNIQAIYNDYLMLKKYLFVTRECKNKTGCWSKDITKAPNGKNNAENATEKGIGGDIITFSLNDGTNVCLDYWGKSDIISRFGVEKNLLDDTLSIWVDVNGDKKPNRLGKDVFAFILTKNGLVPAGTDNKGNNCKTTGYDCCAEHLTRH